MVEAASIALGLHYTREWLWDRLDTRAQGLVADWLGEFIGNPTWPNNWMLFQTVTEEFLSSIGARYEESEILRGLDAIEDWYVGDGWYTDGAGRNFDYYIGWAMHLYPLVWTQMAEGGARGDRALAAREVYRDRLRQFLERYFDFFGSDGAPIHQGRSLTYRFAAAAPIWIGEMFDCSPYDAGLSRRAASGVLKHFAEHGAPDARGLLTLGWHEPFPPMIQNYSGPASPYWASKGFIGLMLPADHRVWTAPESPLPVEVGDFESAIGAGRLVAERDEERRRGAAAEPRQRQGAAPHAAVRRAHRRLLLAAGVLDGDRAGHRAGGVGQAGRQPRRADRAGRPGDLARR